MFSEIIRLLRSGVLPSDEQLIRRLKPAMVKKGGVLQQPRMCWSNDPKINPDTVHLLWSAILSGREDLIFIAVGMLFVEQGGGGLDELTPEMAGDLILLQGDALQALASDRDFGRVLLEKVNEAADIVRRQ